MTSETLSGIAGVLLSLGAAYLPGFSGWFARLDPLRKRLVMLGLLALAAAGSLGAACASWAARLDPAAQGCSEATALEAVRAFLLAMAANQAAFQLAVTRPAQPRPTSFEAGGHEA